MGQVARALSYQPEKDTAVALFDRVCSVRRGRMREPQRSNQDASRANAAAELSAQK